MLQLDKLDPDMKELFHMVGIEDEKAVDKETLDFIYDFVDKSGGIEAVRKEVRRPPPPTPPG